MHPFDGPAIKGFRTGTDRLIPPRDTVARVRPLMPVMGITRIANVTGLDCVGIPVVIVCRPNSRSLAVAQGKGLDLAAAKASGLMESVEAYHAEHIALPLKLCSYEELRYTHQVVDVTQLPRPADSLFDPDQVMLWIEGDDVLQQEPVWVPYQVVHMNYTMAHWNAARTFVASSSGLASGNHLLEAISHAICEVVERDAATLWLLSSEEARRATRIDLDTVDDPACRTVLEKFEHAGIETSVWEITSDIRIPAFRCMISEQTGTSLHRLYAGAGMGCHPVRQIALLRALTEAAQSRLTVMTGSRDDMFRHRYEAFQDPDASSGKPAATLVDSPSRCFQGPSWDAETFEDDVAWELQRLQTVGIERAVVVDLTRPEFQLSVARVVIPGLEHYDQQGSAQLGSRARGVLEQQA